MRIAYFDCFSGASGDMILGALLATGVNEEALVAELRKIPGIEWDLTAERVMRRGIEATQVRITSTDHAHDRSLGEIFAILDAGELSVSTLKKAKSVFNLVAAAEAKVHGTTPEEIHFHELGGIDSILDIVGAVIALDLLGIEEVHASALPLSHGTVRCAHGVLPVPAPAVVEILQGVPLQPVDIEGELVTPTGAAILKTCGKSFGSPPVFSVEAVGYGSGTRDLGTRPNVLRVMVGTTDTADTHSETLTLLETNIDDMNPELYDYVMERLFGEGALDVFLAPIQMKKNRPATLISVLCRPEERQRLISVLLAETTTLGVRAQQVDRVCLPRTSIPVETQYGAVRVKSVGVGPGAAKLAPEYDDCVARAREHGVPAREVFEAAHVAAAARGDV